MSDSNLSRTKSERTPTAAARARARSADNGSLRVLHGLYDIAGQPYKLARALRSQGVAAEAWVFRPHAFGYPNDRILQRDNSPPGVASKWARAFWFAQACLRFDIWHLHLGRSFLTTSRDLQLARALGVRIVLHYRGSEVRPVIGMRELNDSDRAQVTRQLKHADLVLVHDEELARLLRPLWPDPIVCPNIVDIDPPKLAAENNNENHRRNGKLRVVHIPSRPEKKGAELIRSAVAGLQDLVEYDEMSGLSHDEVIREYGKADVVVDQLLVGRYGNASLEAMAVGKPVICRLAEEFSQDDPDDLPIINADAKVLPDVLRRAASDREWLQRLGLQGREYVQANHSPAVVANFLIGHYRRITG